MRLTLEDTQMNLTMPKASAELIKALAKPHVQKALDSGDVEAAKLFQHIISTLDLALELNSPIEFT